MPYGQILTDLMTTSDGVSSAGLYGMKNRLINGDMRIDQRNAGASVTPTDAQYSVDRWVCYRSQASKFSVQQNSGSVTPPTGFTNYAGIVSLSAYSSISTDYFGFSQSIEGFNSADFAFGTASASTVTLSFWVRSSLTGTFGGALRNSALNRTYCFSYSVASANTWEFKTITILGDTSGTWLTNNGVGINVWFDLGSGSSLTGSPGSWSGTQVLRPTGSVSLVGTNGATFYITGVQLEKGSTATSFDVLDYGRSLIQCQRYLPALNNVSSSDQIGFGYSTNTTDSIIGINHPVTTRVPPTGVSVTSVGNILIGTGTGGSSAASAASFIFGGLNQSMILFNRTGLTAGQGSFAKSNGTYQILLTGCEL